ncbi:MAG TPA: DUF2750 domain-containing protein [Myxococcaceae bacterium]|nr:DUF2750 domain-containing protein [Myxococcaceae bacterium]
MTRTLSSEQITAVIALNGPKRYAHFIKRAADEGEAWGLYEGGWALMGDGDERPLFPIWPAREYAQLLAVGEWASHEPRAIPVHSLLDELLPDLREKGTGLAVFPVPSGRGVVPELDVVEADLRQELSRIE